MTDFTPQEMASERIVQMVAVDGGVLALTSIGRLFFRDLDSRNFDPRNPRKYRWQAQEGPLG